MRLNPSFKDPTTTTKNQFGKLQMHCQRRNVAKQENQIKTRPTESNNILLFCNKENQNKQTNKKKKNNKEKK